ncbi:MAG: hypothetical protein ACRD0K_03460 [Egibacteraceae bacterium]
MGRLAWLVIIATAACAAMGGAGGGVREDLTSDEAHARLRQIILDTAEAAAPGAPHPVSIDIGPSFCEEADIAPHVFSTWGVDIAISDGRQPADLLPAVEARWEERGYDIDRRHLDDPHPDLLSSVEGFTFRALAVPGSGILTISGDTPCVPNPEYPG